MTVIVTLCTKPSSRTRSPAYFTVMFPPEEIKGMREELSTRLNSNETMEIIREKEEQIRELLEEGEKLSKQQLQHSNIIKKLRVKNKESETKITKQNKMLKEQEEELKTYNRSGEIYLTF